MIGSHLVDLLVNEGCRVRILDNLEPNTHKQGKPAWINPAAEFVEGDVRDRATTTAALQDIDVVFHQAAYGGYMMKAHPAELARIAKDQRALFLLQHEMIMPARCSSTKAEISGR